MKRAIRFLRPRAEHPPTSRFHDPANARTKSAVVVSVYLEYLKGQPIASVDMTPTEALIMADALIESALRVMAREEEAARA